MGAAYSHAVIVGKNMNNVLLLTDCVYSKER